MYILKDNRGFGEIIKEQLQSIWREIVDFFVLIKENTYDLLCEIFDPTIVNLLLVGIGVVLIMVVAMAVINR